MKLHRFPGNSEAALIIDFDSVISNVQKIFPSNSVLDVGLPPIRAFWEKYSEELLKAGVSSLYSRFPANLPETGMHEIKRYFGPIRFEKDLGFASEISTPIISSYQEALFLSNMGQQTGQNLPFIINIKSSEEEFNQGSFGSLEVIEKANYLPNVEFKGVFVESYFKNDQKMDRLLKTIKSENNIADLICITSESYKSERPADIAISGFNCLGVSSSLNFNLAISIGVVAYPVGHLKNSLKCLINLGSQDGLRPGAKIKIGNEELEFSKIYSHFAEFSADCRPKEAYPWEALLVGEIENLQLSHHGWNISDLKELILAWKHPIYLSRNGNIERL